MERTCCAHRHQHAAVLPDRATAAQEADHHHHNADGDHQVADVGQLGQATGDVVGVPQQLRQRAIVYGQPDAHGQHGYTCELVEDGLGGELRKMRIKTH